jgi:hypothetical protein
MWNMLEYSTYDSVGKNIEGISGVTTSTIGYLLITLTIMFK